MPQLTDEQKTRYNKYRSAGLPPERALGLATKNSDNKYNPALNEGIDNVLVGKNSLGSSVVDGVKNAVGSGIKTIKEDAEKYGAGFAARKAPLSLIAGVGRGVGDVIGGVLETADDLTGETVSSFLQPSVEKAIESDAGQYILGKATELNEAGKGIPGDILDSLDLLGATALVKSGVAKGIKNSVVANSKKGLTVTKNAGEATTSTLKGLFSKKNAAKVADNTVPELDQNLERIKNILQNKLDFAGIKESLDGINDTIKSTKGTDFSQNAFNRVEELLSKQSKNLDEAEKTGILENLKKMEDFLNENDGGVLEKYLLGISGSTNKIVDTSVSAIDKISDKGIDTAVKAVENIKKVPAAISERAKESIDRRIVRTAQSSSEQAKENMLDLYKKGIVPGVKKKNKTITNIDKIDKAIVRTIPRLAKKTDEAGDFIYDVDNIEDFARVITKEKKEIFSDIEKGLADAGESGRAIDLDPIIKELEEIISSERGELSPELRKSAEKAIDRFVDIVDDGQVSKRVSPSGAQDLIADLNAQLQAYYRGSTSGTVADVTIDNLIVNNLRTLTDDIVEDLGEGTFKELKARYADLKKMEDDVVHRAVFEKQKGGGLADLSDISSAGDVVAGVIDPAFMARGIGQFLTKEVTKSLTNKDELIRQMFLYGRNLAPES